MVAQREGPPRRPRPPRLTATSRSSARQLAHTWHILRTTIALWIPTIHLMEAMGRTRWGDDRLDDLKTSVDRLDRRVDTLHQTMIIGFIALGTMMFAGFAAMITLFATHF